VIYALSVFDLWGARSSPILALCGVIYALFVFVLCGAR
jgi:hypothetical protein